MGEKPIIIKRLKFVTAVLSITVLATAGSAPALMIVPGDLADFTAASAQIVRGKCLEAVPGFVEVGGARLAVTTYRFKVVDGLKGARVGRFEFRQVGTAGGGSRDLGRVAGLPVYSPGSEYVLFLLPKSAAGLTSPAGAGQGAFEVAGDIVSPLIGMSDQQGAAALRAGVPTASPEGKRIKYSEFRRRILDLIAAGSASRK